MIERVTVAKVRKGSNRKKSEKVGVTRSWGGVQSPQIGAVIPVDGGRAQARQSDHDTDNGLLCAYPFSGLSFEQIGCLGGHRAGETARSCHQPSARRVGRLARARGGYVLVAWKGCWEVGAAGSQSGWQRGNGGLINGTTLVAHFVSSALRKRLDNALTR